MTGEGIVNPKVELKKKREDSFSTIPVFNQPSDRIVNLNRVERSSDPLRDGMEPPMEEEIERPRYTYIGYEESYSIDDSQSYCNVEMLKQMAMDAYRSKNYYLAMQHFNKILMKNPGNKEALFFKKKMIKLLKDMKQDVV